MGKVLKVLAVVVAVAVIVFAPYLLPPLLKGLAITGFLATAITAAVVIGATVIATRLTAPKPSALGVGPPQVFRQSVSNSFIVYGERRVGGQLVFFHSKKDGGDHYRYFVIAVAGHQCQGVVDWMLNDEVVTVDGSDMVTTGKYAGAAWLWFQRGLASETANATFVSECGGKWTSGHEGNGVAAIYAKFRMDDDVIEAGMPNITAVIEGKDDILDPRTATTGYTRNAALIFYDWMAIPREEGGFGAYDDEIPSDEWISAQANVCDETVDSEARYAIDAVITTGAAPSEIRDALVVNCAGSYTFSEGVHKMRPGYWVAPSETLSEDALAGPIVVSPFMTSDVAANEVQVTYISPDDGYQAAAAVTQTIGAADIRQLDLDLPFVTSPHRAARIARIMLNRAQCEKTLTWPMNIEGLKIGALDYVMVNKSEYSLDNYAWVVTNWQISADFGVMLNLREENEDIYTDPSPVTPDVVPEITVPETLLTVSELQTIIRTVYPRGLTLTGNDVAGDGQIVISDHFHDWPGIGEVAITGTTLTGKTLLATYYVYADLDELADASPTFGATLEYAEALNSSVNPLRMFLNQVIILPGLGDPPTGGDGAGGGYGGGPIVPDEIAP